MNRGRNTKTKDQRREEAISRQEKTALLTPQQRLKKLDDLGLTAKKERAKLAKLKP